MGMSLTESGVPPHLEVLSCPGKPHPGGCRDKGGQSGEGKKERGKSWTAWGRVGVGVGWGLLGKEQRSRQERNRAQPAARDCAGLS